eukprot:12397893-Karenia_brevis.AAC.1
MSAGEWNHRQVASALEHYILGSRSAPASLADLFLEPAVQQHDGSNPVLDHLRGVSGERPFRLYRTKHPGAPGHSAMPPRMRDRSTWFEGPSPCLSHCCLLCEAQFPNKKTWEAHADLIHGGERQSRST